MPPEISLEDIETVHISSAGDGVIFPNNWNFMLHTLALKDCFGLKGKPPSDNKSGETKMHSP